MIFDDFITKQGRNRYGYRAEKERRNFVCQYGKSRGILPVNEQVPGERFEVNERLKVYIMDVKKTTKGPQVFLSRSHPGLVKRLFELEVPEIQEGIVEIRGIAREAGSRTKIAVYSQDENVDPVGACVGNQRKPGAGHCRRTGRREDRYHFLGEDPEELISNVLSPAKVEKGHRGRR